MRFSVLSSGSKANSTLIESGTTRVLIDCGLSARETCRRLVALGINPESLSAVVVSHEHSDHIYGLSALTRKLKIPVYANRATGYSIKRVHALERFVTGETFSIGDFIIHPFSITHDAAEPVGFVVHAEGLKFSHVTDLGKVTPLVEEALQGANAIVLESNHDQDLLMACDYPWALKQRISSTHGHLANSAAGEVLSRVQHSDLLHVVLGHLSENSNTPQMALSTVSSHVRVDTLDSLSCACVSEATPLYDVGARGKDVFQVEQSVAGIVG